MAISQQPPSWSSDQSVPTGVGASHDSESLSTILAEMLAKMKGIEPTQEGFHLYEYLDPDGMDALHEHAQRHEDVTWRLEFEAGDQSVIVRSDGFIRTSHRRRHER